MKRNIKMDQNNMWPFKGLFAGLLIRKLCFLSFLFFSVNSVALDDGTWTYELNGDQVEITGCLETCPPDLVIPSSISGRNVTRIGDEAFFKSQISSVSIPGSINYIGSLAFRETPLTNVTIPEGVVAIESQAFINSQLTNITLPNSLISIAGAAFSGNQLTSVVIPPGVSRIADSVFSENQLTEITIPDGVTAIEDHAFYDWTSLLSIVIAPSITQIGN
jgi:hypothetical protein